MNRRERRTRGKQIMVRLNTLKNSSFLKDADLKDIPEDIVTQLTKGECKNKPLQKKYNAFVRLITETIELESELSQMKPDLASKQEKLQSAQQQKL